MLRPFLLYRQYAGSVPGIRYPFTDTHLTIYDVINMIR